MALTQNKDLPKSSDNPVGPPDLKAHDSIADTLRLARQEHGQDLRTVAQVLRIRHTYLEAIEKGEFEQLPGTAYAIGFLRTYAEFLGLDGEQIVERFKRETHGVEPKMDLVFPEPVGQTRIPGGAIVLISVVLLALAYGGWFYLSNEGKSVADLMPPLPDRLQTMISGHDDGQDGATAEVASSATAATVGAVGGADGSADGGADEGAEAPAYTPPESAEAESPAPAELATPDDPAPVADFEAAQDDAAAPEAAEAIYARAPEVGETTVTPALEIAGTTGALASEAMAEPAPLMAPAPVLAVPVSQPATALGRHATTNSAGSVEPMLDETVVIPAPPTATRDLVLSTERLPRVYGESNLGTRIVLRALEDSWVQVRDRQDALLLTRVLRSGDTYYVPNQDGLTLLTGNAGGIVIEVDGVAVAPLGPIGTVRRQIALDPVRLLDGTAQRR